MSGRTALAGALLSLVLMSMTSTHVQVQEAWVVRYHGPGNAGDHASAVAVDEAGNLYVTGGSTGSLTGPFDYATVSTTRTGTSCGPPVTTAPAAPGILPAPWPSTPPEMCT